MDLTLCDIINRLHNAKELTYLELGVGNGKNFSQTLCKNKTSVDGFKGKDSATFVGTTDEFFAQLDKDTKFDIVFIDACHHYDFVLRDFNNSIAHCNNWIVMHDMIPPTEGHTRPGRCSDGHKLLHHLIEKTNMQIYSMRDPARLGLTFVKMPGIQIAPPSANKDMSYLEFSSWIKTVRLYEENEILDILNYSLKNDSSQSTTKL